MSGYEKSIWCPGCPRPNRDVWRTYTRPGTARAFFKALLSWLSGKGWQFDFPLLAAEDPVEDVGASVTTRDADNW